MNKTFPKLLTEVGYEELAADLHRFEDELPERIEKPNTAPMKIWKSDRYYKSGFRRKVDRRVHSRKGPKDKNELDITFLTMYKKAESADGKRSIRDEWLAMQKMIPEVKSKNEIKAFKNMINTLTMTPDYEMSKLLWLILTRLVASNSEAAKDLGGQIKGKGREVIEQFIAHLLKGAYDAFDYKMVDGQDDFVVDLTRGLSQVAESALGQAETFNSNDEGAYGWFKKLMEEYWRVEEGKLEFQFKFLSEAKKLKKHFQPSADQEDSFKESVEEQSRDLLEKYVKGRIGQLLDLLGKPNSQKLKERTLLRWEEPLAFYSDYLDIITLQPSDSNMDWVRTHFDSSFEALKKSADGVKDILTGRSGKWGEVENLLQLQEAADDKNFEKLKRFLNYFAGAPVDVNFEEEYKQLKQRGKPIADLKKVYSKAADAFKKNA